MNGESCCGVSARVSSSCTGTGTGTGGERTARAESMHTVIVLVPDRGTGGRRARMGWSPSSTSGRP
jgi:hypothetical protein